MLNKLEIIPFDEKYATIFYDLNVEWLQKYFYVEPYDEKVLSNPQKFIINNDGYIFFVKYDKEIIGTVALMKLKNTYELTKMAVSPKYQGLKIGLKLMNYCIQFAKDKNLKYLTLYSHRKLIPAINLYKKVGFIEVALEKDVHYERADIKMILTL